jgi:DNA polymerase
VWINVFRKLIPTMVNPKIENIDDGMALSCRFRTGASLEACAKMLNLPINKDPVGRQLMLKQCKPNAKGEFYELTPDEWNKFEHYGILDTRILRDVYYKLPPLTPSERWAFEWTFKRNLRGIRIDMALVYEMDSIVQENLPGLEREFFNITGTTMNSHVRCKAFFKTYYPMIEDMQKDTVRDMLLMTHYVPPEVKRALEIKSLAGSTSITKIKTAIAQQYNGRIYEVLAYSYAQTLRWAGRGIQIQNFARVDDKKADNVKFDMNIKDLAGVVRGLRPGLKDPIGFVKNLLRRVWIPVEGNAFYSGDFSKVEPCTLFWLLDMGEIPDKWYEEMAAEIYNLNVTDISKDSDERQIGKTAQLSCGYGAGWKSFKLKTFKDTGILLTDEMAKMVVNAYRRKYPSVPAFWRDLQNSFRKAIMGEGSILCGGKIHIMPMPSPWEGVQIRLPSGGYLYYHGAQANMESRYVRTISGVDEELTFSQWEKLSRDLQAHYVETKREILTYLSDQGSGRVGRDYIYGGLLCENVVSATSREVMVPAMWRLENAGFDVLGSVHDELWGETASGRCQEFEALMCANPSWCDMKIKAEAKEGVRYLK